MSAILPDCTLCDGPVRLDFDGTTPIEVCQRCGATNRPVVRKPTRRDRAEVRGQVREIRRRRPLLCPSCLRRLCRACRVVTCECPGNHPRRPVGDLSPEGMALLAGEKPGHLEPAELTGGAR